MDLVITVLSNIRWFYSDSAGSPIPQIQLYLICEEVYFSIIILNISNCKGAVDNQMQIVRLIWPGWILWSNKYSVIFTKNLLCKSLMKLETCCCVDNEVKIEHPYRRLKFWCWRRLMNLHLTLTICLIWLSWVTMHQLAGLKWTVMNCFLYLCKA